MCDKGYSLVEILVSILVISVITVIGLSTYRNYAAETKLAMCLENLRAHDTMTMQLWEQNRRILDRDVLYQMLGDKRDPHLHYTPNIEDWNHGHGNDMDGCDEDNPGRSTRNRECIEFDYIWTCDHDHGELARYCFIMDGHPPAAVPIIDNQPPVLGRDIIWWEIKDPFVDKWKDKKDNKGAKK